MCELMKVYRTKHFDILIKNLTELLRNPQAIAEGDTPFIGAIRYLSDDYEMTNLLAGKHLTKPFSREELEEVKESVLASALLDPLLEAAQKSLPDRSESFDQLRSSLSDILAKVESDHSDDEHAGVLNVINTLICFEAKRIFEAAYQEGSVAVISRDLIARCTKCTEPTGKVRQFMNSDEQVARVYQIFDNKTCKSCEAKASALESEKVAV